MNIGIKQAIQKTRNSLEQTLGQKLADIAASLTTIFNDTEALQTDSVKFSKN